MSKRKQSLQSGVEDLSHKQTIQDNLDDESLSRRLDAIIEPDNLLANEEPLSEMQMLAETQAEPSPVEEEVSIYLDESEVANKYVQQFNNLLTNNKVFLDEAEQQNLHTQAAQAVVYDYLNGAKSPQTEQEIVQICENIRSKEITIQKLCVNIEKQRQILIEFIEQLKSIPSGFERDRLISFFETKTNNPYYLSIKHTFLEVLSKGKYVDNEDEIVKNIIFHVKILILLTPYEYGLLTNIAIENNAIKNPYNSIEMEALNEELNNFISNFSIQGMEKVTRFIHHSIEYDSALISSGKKNELLAKIDFTSALKESFQMLIDNKALWTALENDVQFKKSKITYDDILKTHSALQVLQQQVNQFGRLKVQLTINKNDFTVIKQIQSLHQEITAILETFKIIKTLKSIIGNQSADFKNIKQNISTISRILLTIKNIFKEVDIDNYGVRTILVFRIGRGDFFNASDRDNLVSATFAIHKVVQPIKLFNSLIENFKQYTEEKQQECLLFLKNYLLLDTDHSLINVKFEQSEIIDKIEMFCQFAHDNSKNQTQTEPIIEEITDILVKKIVDKSNLFSSQMNSISKGEIPQSQLYRRVNSMLKEIPENINNKSLIEEYLLEMNFIIESPTLISFAENQINEQLIQAIQEFCEKLKQSSQFSDLATSLQENFQNQLAQPASEPVEILNEIEFPNMHNFDIVKLMHEVIIGHKLIAESEKSILALIDAIESVFIFHFTQIDLAQLRELFWTQDNKRIADGLMPLSPNIRKYYQYFNLVVNYFALSIPAQVENIEGDIIPRESLHETKRVYEFLEKAVMRALDKGAFASAIALNSALNLAPIKRLALSNAENEALRNKEIKKILTIPPSANFRIFQQEGLPYLGFMLDQIIKDYKRKVGSEFEKRVLIGRVLQSIEEKKHAVKENLIVYDLANQMYHLLRNANLTLSPILKGDIIVNDNKVIYLLSNASEYIKPDEFKTYKITDFHTLPGLRDQLSYWYNRMQDFHIDGKNPQVQIVELIKSLVENDDNLEHFNEAAHILSLIDLIDKSNQRVYKNYDHDLDEILKVYHKKITLLLNNELSEPLDSLDTFFSILYNDPKVKAIDDRAMNDLPRFSAQRHLKETINTLRNDQRKYTDAISMANESRTQQAYSQLLIKVLEGNKQSPIIQIGATAQVESEQTRSLLPETEFPVPQAEPEHPDYIGINRTMNFNPDSKYKSILHLFSCNELKKDFLQSFPWGLDTHQAKKIESIKYTPGINLIALEHAVDPHVQLTLMKYILLSLDCMGKLAGNHGELSIVNFNQIKSIADALQEVAALLSYSELDNEIFITRLDHMSYKLILLNNDLADMFMQSNPPMMVSKNEAMNDFCHINEYISHKLLGIPYQKSALTPMNPFSATLASLTPKLKEDLLRHSGVDTQAIAKLSKQYVHDSFSNQTDFE